MVTNTKYYDKLLKKALAEIEEPIDVSDFDNLSPKELKDKLHQSSVYEIELKIQNEELIESQQRLIDAVNEQKNLSAEYESLFNEAPIAYVILDIRGLIVNANTRFCELVNIKDLSMIKSRPLDKFISTAEKNIFKIRYPAFFKNPEGKSFSLSFVSGSKLIPVHATGNLIDNKIQQGHGKGGLLRLVLMDMTEVESLQEELRLTSRVFDVSADALIITDSRMKILKTNPVFSQLTGYSENELIGQTPSILSSGYENSEYYQEMWQTLNNQGFWNGEIRDQKKNGEFFDTIIHISSLKNSYDEVTHYIISFNDITQEKANISLIEHLAQYDHLTDLPNRTLLNDRLQQAIKLAQRNNSEFAVLFIDLDHFKNLNDTLGHQVGDALLKQIATRMKSCLRKTDTIARFGGDEFVVLLGEFKENTDVIKYTTSLAQKLLSSLNEPFKLEESDYISTFSLGIAIYPYDADTAQNLIKHADTAMYQAKKTGRNTFCFYSYGLSKLLKSHSEIEQDLRVALDKTQFRLYYQPQVNLHTGKLIGMEALIRWMHPVKGLIMPDDFLGTAERIGLLQSIDHWVVEEACQQIKTWLQQKKSIVPISINLSHHQFQPGSQIVNFIESMLESYEIEAKWLCIEVTESGIMKDIDSASHIIYKLQELGIEFALDDFGTGYSSLTYLRQLPMNVLKIDKSFVQDALNNEDNATIITAIISMTQGMGLSVLAEGVETEDQEAFLVELGCQFGQGYLYKRPISNFEFETLYFT